MQACLSFKLNVSALPDRENLRTLLSIRLGNSDERSLWWQRMAREGSLSIADVSVPAPRKGLQKSRVC